MNTLSMARRKKELTPNQKLAQAIVDQYQPKSVEDMQDALKDIFGPMFEAMLKGEMNSHLGYFNNKRGEKDTPNRRNGYSKKTLKTTAGDVAIEVPRDRDGSFEPLVVPKRKRDVSAIENKVLAMYAKGLSRRDIADTIEDIYGFEIEFERFRQAWSQYPGAVDVWVRNWKHVAQLFNYGSAVRKILYTTNAVESVNSSFRKVTKKGAFPNENALLKLLYLRITELYKKWNVRPLNNRALIRNQLDIDEKIRERIRKYENVGF